MVLTVMVAEMIGCTLPIIAKKLGFDPAVMASPFITTIVDAVSLLLYFGIATLLLFR
jgi:magnesium transporter